MMQDTQRMKCVIKNCSSYRRKLYHDTEIFYFEFPKDKDKLKIWTELVCHQRNDENWRPTSASRMCSLHFNWHDKYKTLDGKTILKTTAVPRLKLYLSGSDDAYEETQNEISVAEVAKLAFASTTSSDVPDIEEFKRKMIYTVARARKDNTPEEQMWQELKEDTGIDCQPIWQRMCSLTTKKLDQLLLNGDRVAPDSRFRRLTPTEWKLFDLVLVHEGIDVIGQTFETPPRKILSALIEVFCCAAKFNVEAYTGKSLLRAWHRATVHYTLSSQGRQVSPMLLQLRWHQLKQKTRKDIFDLSRRYRKRRFGDIIKHATGLTANIARRYPNIVTKPHYTWEGKVKKGLVILSEQFDEFFQLKKHRNRFGKTSESVVVPSESRDTIVVDDESDPDKSDDNFNVDEPQSDLAPSGATEEIRLETQSSILRDCLRGQNVNEDSLHANEKTLCKMTEIETFLAHFSDVADSSLVNRELDKLLGEKAKLLEKANLQAKVSKPLLQSTHVHYTRKNVCLSNNTSDIIGATSTEIPNLLQITEVKELNQNNAVKVMSDLDSDIPNQINKIDCNNLESNNNGENILPNDEKETDYTDVEMLDIKENPLVTVLSESAHVKMETPDSKDFVTKICINALNQLKRRLDNGTVNHNQFEVELDDIQKRIGSATEIVDNGIAYLEENVEDDLNFVSQQPELKIVPDYKDDPKLLLIPVVYLTDINKTGTIKTDPDKTIKGQALLETIIERNSKLIIQKQYKKQQVHYNISKGEHYSPDINNKRAKMTTDLFKQHCARIFNPKMFSNPDFNTRLKGLDAAFFNIPENVRLLKQCKPLTIDISEAFEKKLVGGKIFLETDIAPKVANNSKYVNIPTVTPLSSATQSNLDNQSDEPTPNTSNRTKSDILERRREITLLDIDEVRRINQKLLSAQVTAIQVQNNATPSSTVQSDNQPSSGNIPHTTQLILQHEQDHKRNTTEEVNLTSSVSKDGTKNTVDQKLAVHLDTIEQYVRNQHAPPVLDRLYHSSIANLNIAQTTQQAKKSETADLSNNTQEVCCWASAKIEQLVTCSERLNCRHACDARVCTCCCKELLRKYEDITKILGRRYMLRMKNSKNISHDKIKRLSVKPKNNIKSDTFKTEISEIQSTNKDETITFTKGNSNAASNSNFASNSDFAGNSNFARNSNTASNSNFVNNSDFASNSIFASNSNFASNSIIASNLNFAGNSNTEGNLNFASISNIASKHELLRSYLEKKQTLTTQNIVDDIITKLLGNTSCNGEEMNKAEPASLYEDNWMKSTKLSNESLIFHNFFNDNFTVEENTEDLGIMGTSVTDDTDDHNNIPPSVYKEAVLEIDNSENSF